MILHNATILTMDEALPRASALAIAGGRVLGGVDSREDAIASHAHERVDLQGATVVPGLVDAHVHFRAWALARIRVQLSGAASRAQALEALRQHAQGLPADGWVLGGGWRDELLARGVEDHASELDAAVSGRPAALVSKDGHALWLNEAALERLELHAGSLQQPGGVVERTAGGSFAGVLREQSAWSVRRLLPTDDLDNRALAAAMREANRRGVTALHDMDGAAGFRAWRRLEQERGLSLRVWQHFLVEDLPHLSALGISGGFGSDRLRVGGIKVFADGTLGSGTAWLHEPEQQVEGQSAREPVVISDRSRIGQLAVEAAAAGLPLLVHAIGDAAVTAVLDALQATADHWTTLPVRPRIEHAQLMRPADMERAVQMGVTLSVQPSHLVCDRDVAEARWGGRAAHAYAYQSMVSAGATVVFGSDAPIEELNPLAALHAATTRDGGAHGLQPARGAWHPHEAVDVDTALRASTSWCADAAGVGEWLGRLSPGRAADLVVLSGNPLVEPVADLQVIATMVAGRWVYGAADLRSR